MTYQVAETATARQQLLADQRGDRPDLHALTATDIGHTIRVEETASNGRRAAPRDLERRRPLVKPSAAVERVTADGDGDRRRRVRP